MPTFLNQEPRETSFRKLYEDYYAPFCLYAKRYIEDGEVRQDIVSEVFAQLWNKQDVFDADSTTALGYIKMCVKNSCLNYLKHQDHVMAYAEQIQQRIPVYETEPDSVYTADELYRMLHEALEKMSPEYRKVFIDTAFKGKTHAEIAEELNISVKSVNRYKQRVIELLREELKDFLPLILLIINANRDY